MRLVMTLLVRDEVDVVAAMIEHHLAAGVDHIVATDNGSVDGTAEVLAAYRDAGVLDLIHEPNHTYDQSRWVTRMARRATIRHGADWVINADADEFWWARDSDNLAVTLGILPAQYGFVHAARENLLADPLVEGSWLGRLVLRDLLSLHERGGRIGNKVIHRGHPEVSITQGNHGVTGDDRWQIWPGSPITILHVPDRGYRQFAHKTEVGGSSLAANNELKREFGWHWRADYQRLLEGTLYDTWSARQLDPATAASGLAEGRLVRDERLHRRVSSLMGDAVLPDALSAALAWIG